MCTGGKAQPLEQPQPATLCASAARSGVGLTDSQRIAREWVSRAFGCRGAPGVQLSKADLKAQESHLLDSPGAAPCRQS